MSRKHPWDFERACIESVGHSGWYWPLGSKSSNPWSWAVCPFIYVFSNFSHRRFVVFIVESLLPRWSQHWHPEACIVTVNLVSEWGCVTGPPQETHRSCSQRCPTLATSEEGVRQASLLWLLYFSLRGDPLRWRRWPLTLKQQLWCPWGSCLPGINCPDGWEVTGS